MKRSNGTSKKYFRLTDILGLFAAITFSTFLAAMLIVFGITFFMVRTGTFRINGKRASGRGAAHTADRRIELHSESDIHHNRGTDMP